ncbi:MAG: biotin--[acetyl-CoA-carboxylase] ligase [Acidobacteria bacterium]|nr:biotin--[acetyl-CoA-carboxylase] ligase [Acidobacteriota bacterium]
MNITVLTFDTLDSTNTEALKQARLGADEGLCVLADHQTAGRGRNGRTWISAKGSGLYFSIVLRPKIDSKYVPLITLMTGVAVHDTLAGIGLRPDIKWVNDVLANEKKISGILAETAETSKGLAVVAGIGINIRSSNFPDEIADIATSIEHETGRVISPAKLASALTGFINYFYDILTGEEGPAKVLSAWQSRSTYFSGKKVKAWSGNETITGTTDGLEANGALRIRDEDGKLTIVHAGYVERLRQAE